MRRKHLVQIIIVLVFFFAGMNFSIPNQQNLPDLPQPELIDPAFLKADTAWVDSLLETMSLEEKIAQSIMVAAYSDKSIYHVKNVEALIKKEKVGGLIFFTGGPVRQVNLINHYQALSKIPLLVALDAENGPGMRLDSTMSYPHQMMLGAIQDNSMVYQTGFDIGKQLKRLGIHMNMAPSVDINSNPYNPIINYRSFGEDRLNVALKGLMFAKGMEDAGVLCAMKHFPGHGDTHTDSHEALPFIPHPASRIDSIELYPFKYGIRNGVSGIMMGHLKVPALDPTENLATSLSKPVVTGLLKDSLNFKGLVITDGLGMKSVSSYFAPGEAEAKAYLAGNDILLMPKDVHKAISYIKKEVRHGNISEEEVNARCRKILFAKSWLGLSHSPELSADSIFEDLNNPFYKVEKRKLIRDALTLVKNEGNVIPFPDLRNAKIASLSIGTGEKDVFSQNLKSFADVDTYYADKMMLHYMTDSLNGLFSKYNTLIISIYDTNQWPGRGFGITQSTLKFLLNLQFEGDLILSLFGNPYALSRFSDLSKFDAILVGYEDLPDVKDLAAQALFGAFEIQGKLPVSVKGTFNVGQGINIADFQRLGLGFPEESGLNSTKLKEIDTIVNEAIKAKAFPGCQVLICRHSKVVFHKEYGFYTYNSKHKMSKEDIFDLASITKVAATLPSLIKMESEGKFSTDKKLGDYLSLPDTSNKKELLIKDILAHQSGLKPWIPFYYHTIEPLDSSEGLFSNRYSNVYALKMGKSSYANRNVKYIDGAYSFKKDDKHSIEVADRLFLRNDYRDSIYQWIEESVPFRSTETRPPQGQRVPDRSH